MYYLHMYHVLVYAVTVCLRSNACRTCYTLPISCLDRYANQVNRLVDGDCVVVPLYYDMESLDRVKNVFAVRRGLVVVLCDDNDRSRCARQLDSEFSCVPARIIRAITHESAYLEACWKTISNA